jgi:hypothetical protein
MNMRKIVVVLVLLLGIAAPAAAQKYEPANSHERAAAELIQLLKVEESSRMAIDAMIESMVAQNPMLAEVRDIFNDFFREFSRWEALYPEYIRIYRNAYTEAELRELIAFYKTPVGRKTVELMPRLMQEGMEVGQRQMEPHLPELQRRLQARMMGGG